MWQTNSYTQAALHNMELYQQAAIILNKFAKKQGSVKNLVFASNYENVRQLFALVCESIKYQTVLMAILERCDSLKAEKAFLDNPYLAIVLLYDHLVGKSLGKAGKIRSSILKHKQNIKAVTRTLLQEGGVASLAGLLSSQCQTLNKLPLPRYARVNLLKITVEDAVSAFAKEGWEWSGKLTITSFQSDVEALGKDRFGLDPLLPDLLIFPQGTDLHDHWLTLAGSILLQDRASCFPAYGLDPPHGATVLDCCAAPGNKTTHLASLMRNSGKILAYEMDAKRVGLLRQQLLKAGVTNTSSRHKDFLLTDPCQEEFAEVRYILVDPSCSGSGMLSRMENIKDSSSQKQESAKRLQKLQGFQISMLKHALRFPAVERVVYSTCSIYEEENEAVVTEVAQQFSDTFKVKEIFPDFPHRGKGNGAIAKSCLRMSPKKDLTNGFFVACFERLNGRRESKQESCLVVKKKRKRSIGNPLAAVQTRDEINLKTDNLGNTFTRVDKPIKAAVEMKTLNKASRVMCNSDCDSLAKKKKRKTENGVETLEGNCEDKFEDQMKIDPGDAQANLINNKRTSEILSKARNSNCKKKKKKKKRKSESGVQTLEMICEDKLEDKMNIDPGDVQAVAKFIDGEHTSQTLNESYKGEIFLSKERSSNCKKKKKKKKRKCRNNLQKPEANCGNRTQDTMDGDNTRWPAAEQSIDREHISEAGKESGKEEIKMKSEERSSSCKRKKKRKRNEQSPKRKTSDQVGPSTRGEVGKPVEKRLKKVKVEETEALNERESGSHCSFQSDRKKRKKKKKKRTQRNTGLP